MMLACKYTPHPETPKSVTLNNTDSQELTGAAPHLPYTTAPSTVTQHGPPFSSALQELKLPVVLLGLQKYCVAPLIYDDYG